MGAEELSGEAANTAIGTSVNKTPETAMSGMNPRTIRFRYVRRSAHTSKPAYDDYLKL